VASSRVGEQLLLDLREPWNGVSPRSLCKVNLERRFGGTGRANRYESLVFNRPDNRRVLQLWLFKDDQIS